MIAATLGTARPVGHDKSKHRRRLAFERIAKGIGWHKRGLPGRRPIQPPILSKFGMSVSGKRSLTDNLIRDTNFGKASKT